MRRFFKQLAYALFYLTIWTGIGFGAYFIFFTESPTCFDNIQNQLETAMDCGPDVAVRPKGPFTKGGCIPCELKTIELSVGDEQIFPIGDFRSTIIVEIENKSSNYGLEQFDYSVEVLSRLGPRLALLEKTGYALPGEKKYLIISGLDLDSRDIGKVNLVIDESKLDWKVKSDLPPPPDLRIISSDFVNGEEFIRGEGEVRNDSGSNFKKIILAAFIYGESNQLIGVSTTELENIKAFEQNKFIIFLPSIEYKKIEIIPDIIP